MLYFGLQARQAYYFAFAIHYEQFFYASPLYLHVGNTANAFGKGVQCTSHFPMARVHSRTSRSKNTSNPCPVFARQVSAAKS